MKKVLCILLAVVMLLSMVACANTEKDWQKQYDLGMRYLEDGNYEEAILAFTAAIDIDSSRPEAYIGRAEAYEATGEMEKALKDYKNAQRAAKNQDDDDLVEELEEKIEELEIIIEQLDIIDVGPAPENQGNKMVRAEHYNSNGALTYLHLLDYDENGRLVKITYKTYTETGEQRSEVVTAYYYDEAGRLTGGTFGDTGEWTCSYDANGNLVHELYVDGGWTETFYTYDANGALQCVEKQSQIDNTITTYTYNDKGQLAEAYSQNTHEYGVSESWAYYTYDQLGKLSQTTEVWAEGTHYTAFTYCKGLTVETKTFDYTHEADIGFRIQSACGHSLWFTSLMEGSYTLDEKNRVATATGYGYNLDGLTQETIHFYYDDSQEQPEEPPQEQPENPPQEEPEMYQEVPVEDAGVYNALNALLIGTDWNSQSNHVQSWSDDVISEMIYRKLVDNIFQYGDDSYLRNMGLTWEDSDNGYVRFSLDKVQKLTKDTFGRAFPVNVNTSNMYVSGEHVMISLAVGEYRQFCVQSVTRKNDIYTAVGTSIYTCNTSRDVRGYFRATFRENPASVYGFTLISLENVPGNQSFSNLQASASSVLQERTITHYAKHLLDGRLDTAWVESVQGVGINEWILLETTDGSQMEVGAMELNLGYQKSEDTLTKNGWPWMVRIDCEGGFSQVVTFDYYNDVAVLDRSVKTSWVKITILDACAGYRYEDTCISEIRLFGLKTAETTQNTTGSPYEQYKAYFYANYSSSDLVCLADVTHDGVEDMIVVNFSDESRSTIYGHVYTIRNGQIQEIYTKQGSEYHAGGFFAWYLVPVPDSGYCNLAEESFGMWQGIGTVTYSEYLLTNDGDKIEVNYLQLDSDEEGNHDEYGMVTEEAWHTYAQQLNRELAECYQIYCSSSNGGGFGEVDTSPANVFAR